jgi:hypothetical protein
MSDSFAESVSVDTCKPMQSDWRRTRRHRGDRHTGIGTPCCLAPCVVPPCGARDRAFLLRLARDESLLGSETPRDGVLERREAQAWFAERETSRRPGHDGRARPPALRWLRRAPTKPTSITASKRCEPSAPAIALACRGALPLAGTTFAIPPLHNRKILPLAEPLVARPWPIVLVRFARYMCTRAVRPRGRSAEKRRRAARRGQWVSRHSIARTRSSATSTAANSAAVM